MHDFQRVDKCSGLSPGLGTESSLTPRWRRESRANSSLKRRPGDRAVNPGGGDRRRKGLTGVFGRYKKGMTWSHSPESWPFLRRTRPSLFWSRVQKFGQNSHSERPNHKLFQWFMRQFPTYRKRVFISAKTGNWKGRIRGFFDLDQGIPHFCPSLQTWRPRSSVSA